MAGLLMVGLFLLPSTVMAQSPGGVRPFTSAVPGNVAKSIGQYKILYIPATFLDRYDMPITQAEAQGMMREVADFYAASSYGQLTILPTVCPGVVLPHSAAWYEQRDAAVGVNGDMDSRRVLHADARAAARKLGYDSNAFDLTIVRQDSELTNNASTNEGFLWLGSNDASTAAHEIGHTLGLNHANAWSTSGTSVSGPGADEEYGHVFDRMALYTVPFPEGQFNVVAKSQLGWLPSSAVRRITSSGTYRIDAMDTGRLEAGHGYALQIVKDAQRTYWAEVRSLFDSNPWAAKGVVLQWSFPQGGTSNAQLLDTTPGSPFGMADSPLSVGRTFSDREAGIHLTTLA
ncbi:MAG: reprolysin-like metallopeptidase, partial [Chthoniobacteraceae bacterium]